MNAHARQVAHRFGAEAHNWDDLYKQPSARSIYVHNLQRRRQRALELIAGVEGRVLEVGCGAGNVILSIPEGGARPVGVDFSVAMLARARQNANGRQEAPGLIAADALALPFACGLFGAILCLGLLEYIPHDVQVLAECHRVLRPGGRLIVSVPNIASPFIRVDDFVFGLKNAVTQSLPAGLRSYIKARVFGRPDRPYFNHRRRRFAPRAFADTLECLGFRVQKARYHTFGFGLLAGLAFNVRMSEHLESRTYRGKTLEKLGWTCIFQATK